MIEISCQVDDDDSGEKGWRMRLPAVPRAGEYLQVGDPDSGYGTWRVVRVHWQYRKPFDQFELVTLLVEKVDR